MRLGRRARVQLPPFPANDLERVYLLARSSGDDAKFLRALARDVVVITQPGPGPAPGRPEFGSGPAGERPLPVAEGKDGRQVLLAWTSGAALFRSGADDSTVWAQIPAGQLFDTLPPDMPVLLNPGLAESVLLEPEDVRTVADLGLGRNVLAAYTRGPATKLIFGTPAHEPVDILAAAARACARHPQVLSAHRALATLEEPEARLWTVLGVRLEDAARSDQQVRGRILQDVLDEVQRSTEEFVELYALPSASTAPSDADRFLLEQPPFYERTGEESTG